MNLLSNIKKHFKDAQKDAPRKDWKEIRYFSDIDPNGAEYERKITARRKFDKAVAELQKTVRNFQVKRVHSVPRDNGITHLILQYKCLKLELESRCLSSPHDREEHRDIHAYTDDKAGHFSLSDKSDKRFVYCSYLGELLNDAKTLAKIEAAMTECAAAAVQEGDGLVVEMRFNKKPKNKKR